MIRKAEKQAEDLIVKLGVKKLPIPVEKIAAKLNLPVVSFDFGPNVSGALLISNGKSTIGVNKTESVLRRRFTVAHELGHYVLHNASNEIFVDRNLLFSSKIMFRDEESSSGKKHKEIEANAFAAALLMPLSFLKAELEVLLKGSNSESDEGLIKQLAKRFQVSEISMTYRLMNLGMLK